MKIKALAPWYGGKRTLAPRIVEALGPHTFYIEPFCGSMSILFAKPKSRMELVNDLHGDLINLARVVQDGICAAELHERLQLVLAHEDALDYAQCELKSDDPIESPDVDRALAYFVASWLGRNGEAGLDKCGRAGRLCVRWSANGGDPATRFRTAIASIPDWWKRLQGVTILRRDAFELLEKVSDNPGSVIYCDPPYLVKSDEYLHDFQPAAPLLGREHDDHERLARALSGFGKTRCVVSYYEHPRLDELYPRERWTRIDCEMAKATSHVNGAKGRAPEVLLVNGGADAANLIRPAAGPVSA
jgi:DNA adenine methylase